MKRVFGARRAHAISILKSKLSFGCKQHNQAMFVCTCVPACLCLCVFVCVWVNGMLSLFVRVPRASRELPDFASSRCFFIAQPLPLLPPTLCARVSRFRTGAGRFCSRSFATTLRVCLALTLRPTMQSGRTRQSQARRAAAASTMQMLMCRRANSTRLRRS